ncbi:MAG TPA: methyltransferase domain-containing protein [Flavisolibacter sp.]
MSATTPYNPETYWDSVARSIQSRQGVKIIAGDDEPYYRYKRRRFLELLSKIDFSGKTVLEVGSGPGGNLDFIHRSGCKKITGVDISQQMISLSKELLSGKKIDIIKINGKDLPFNDQTFDIVFTSTVLQHNTDESLLQPLIKDICRVAKEEVLLFERIESKITGHETNLGRPVRYYEQHLNAYHFTLVSKQALPIQASYFVCGAIRKIFNKSTRREGERLSKLSIALERLTLPLTDVLDKLIPSNRDLMLLKFKRIK